MDVQPSEQEKEFLTKSMINRNRRFYDIESINRRESLHEVNRRRPLTKWDLPEDKFNTSFMNSTAAV
jgi:hypothetical protein